MREEARSRSVEGLTQVKGASLDEGVEGRRQRQVLLEALELFGREDKRGGAALVLHAGLGAVVRALGIIQDLDRHKCPIRFRLSWALFAQQPHAHR